MQSKLPRLLPKLKPLIAPLAAIVVVFNAWFLNFSVRTAGDWGYFVKAASDTLRRHYFAIWLSDTQFGRVLVDAGQAPTYAAYGWLSYYLHTDYALNERLIHLWPAVIVAVFGSYALVRYIFRDKPAAVLGSIVYSANTYYLALLTGGLTLAVAYALAPLVVLFYMKAINGRNPIDIIACALLLAACGAYEPRVGYIVVFVLLILAAVHFFCLWQPKTRLLSRSTLNMLVVYASPIVLFGLLNVYWIMGLAHAGGAASNAVISSSLFGNEFFSISGALTLFHAYWTGGQIQPFFVHPVPLYFWLIPLAAIGGLAVSKRTPVVLFFAVIGVVGILLTKQSDEPFAGLYHWMFAHVPGFNAFREASKFYLLTALSYAVLLPALYWYVKTHYRKKWLTVGCFAVLALLFLPNLVPVATNAIGGTFRPRKMPEQYAQLNKFLDTPDYGRVLWVPQKSRWSFSSVNHPAVSASDLVEPTLKDLANSYPSNNNATPTDEINALLQQNYLPALLADAGVRYVIVPMRDIANEDNFYRNYNDDPAMFAQTLTTAGYLKEATAHIKGFKIYETVDSPKPYFSSTTQLYGVKDSDELSSAYDFWQKTLGTSGNFNFTLGPSAGYTTDITDLFGDLTSSGLRKGTLPVAKTASQKHSTYYFDQSYSGVTYTAGPDSISFQTNGLPTPSGGPSTGSNEASAPLSAGSNYIIRTGTDIEPVARDSAPTYLGSPRSDTDLYAIDSANLVPAPTINKSLWQKDVENCVPYGGSAANVDMASSEDADLNKPVLSLMADDHAACSGPPAIQVQSGETYLLRFRYRGFNSQFAGYRLTYNTSHDQTVTTDIPVSDDVWHTYRSLVTVPSGASNVIIRLLARPSNQIKDNIITSYTDLSLVHLQRVTTFKTATGNIRQTNATPTALQTAQYKGYPYNNLIPNGSFEKGPWKRQVGDCDAYDDEPALRMSLVKRSPGAGRALQLEAKRHIACTNPNRIDVKGGATYLLQFDYQSPNADNAGYVITLDDKNATRLNQMIPIKDPAWHTYTHTITVPPDAHSLSLAVFAYSNADQAIYITNRYDNFVLQRIPDVQNRFYAVSNPETQLSNPQKISYQNVSSTYKKVTVKDASKPFVLLMSEQYHPSWHIVLGNAADARSRTYLPWLPQPELSATDHLEANGFENAWYIDPQAMCKISATACIKHADGSYDLQFGVQFSAQRWFNFGMLISGATGVACVSTLIVLIRKRRRITRVEKEVNGHEAEHTR